MIKILTGRQTDPLQEKILDEAVQNYQRQPEHETFIIVPNHIKFTTEVKAINQLAKLKGQQETAVKNLQVLSFSRLAWYFLKDAEEGLPAELDDAAAAMLLAQIVQAKKDELILFKNTSVNTGLVKQIYKTILQIYDANLDLDEISQSKQLDSETKSKIHDLRIIYKEFLKEIAGKFSTKNEVQLKLNELLAKTKRLEKTSFYFSDFSHFTLQECLTIKLLFKKAQNVTLAFKTKDGTINPNSQKGDYDFVIQRTIAQLLNFLNERNIAYQNEVYPLNPKPSNRELINELWTNELAQTEAINQVQLVKADSRYAEAYFVARTIYQQVALNHYRYRDFLVLAPNLHEYETYLLPIFRQNKLPFFNDLQQEMKYHPLVVLIENLAQLWENPFTTANMLAILKTKLLIPDWYRDEASYLHDVDELENFVLAHGIRHNLWQRSFTEYLNAEVIRIDKMPDEIGRIDRLRQFFVDKIEHLFASLKKEKDNQKAVTIFFNFLTDNGIAKKLEEWRDKANEAGDLQQAQQPEQLWQLLIQLLQDYLLINKEVFDAGAFFQMLISGFKEATFSQIPSTLDAVNLSEIGMVQNSGYKQVFIIGATSNNLPKIQKTPNFLSSENLANINSNFNNDSYLEDQQTLNNLDQNYQFGLALSLAANQIYLSYPVLNAANEQLEPSIFYKQLQAKKAPEMQQHDLPEKTSELLSFMTNSDASLGYLTYLKATNNTSAVSSLLTLTKKIKPVKTQKVLEALQFNNQPEDINPELAQKLYGPNLNSSVSQLETYYQNSYEYFLTYGLRLHKRFENELDVIQAGNYFHETFDRLVKELRQKKLDLGNLDSQELDKLLNLAREEMKDEGQYQQLMNDPFNRYLFNCLDHTTTKVAHNWQKSLKNTPLRARYSELAFGSGERVKGLDFKLSGLDGQHQVRLRGKIDRVDLMQNQEKAEVLGQVIDYKSSAKKFDLALFLNGISLQMISYLDVLNHNPDFFAGKKRLSLLGAFYQTVTRQLDRLNSKELIASDLTLKKQALNNNARLMYSGIMSNNPDLLSEAEPLLKQKGDKSHIYYGVGTKARGGLKLPANSSFSDEEIQLLLQYDEYLIQKASSEILTGKIDLNPYRLGKNKNALTYSDYRDIFFFDAMLKENQYHEIQHLSKKEFLSDIKDKLNKEGEK